MGGGGNGGGVDSSEVILTQKHIFHFASTADKIEITHIFNITQSVSP